MSAGYGRMDQDTQCRRLSVPAGTRARLRPVLHRCGRHADLRHAGSADRGLHAGQHLQPRIRRRSRRCRRISAGYNQNYKYTHEDGQPELRRRPVRRCPRARCSWRSAPSTASRQVEFDTDFLTQARAAAVPELPAGERDLQRRLQSATTTCKELYAGVLRPDYCGHAAGVKALNLTVGVRYSDYSTFGDTTERRRQGRVAADQRPADPRLVRGGVPRADDLSTCSMAPTAECADVHRSVRGHRRAADVAANPNLALACQNVPLDGTFAQPNSQITGLDSRQRPN